MKLQIGVKILNGLNGKKSPKSPKSIKPFPPYKTKTIFMYYEARNHELVKLGSLQQALNRIRKSDANNYDLLLFPIASPSGKIHSVAMMNDAHIDDRNFSETAVVLATETNEKGQPTKFYKLESLSLFLMSDAEVHECLQSCIQEEEEKQLVPKGIFRPASVTYMVKDDTEGKTIRIVCGNKNVTFCCTCCGSDFVSTLAEQEGYDQDEGYGVCPDCEEYYK